MQLCHGLKADGQQVSAQLGWGRDVLLFRDA